METNQFKRKRSRTSSSPGSEDMDDSKKRGRPRVEKQDESAADRRRTQIRMAQRAYRQRKESTLDDLRKRVSDVTNTAELMNKAFQDLRDRMAMSGVSQMQLHEINETAEHFMGMMKVIRNTNEDPAFDSNVSPTAKITKPQQQQPLSHMPVEQQVIPAPKNVPAWMDATAMANGPRTMAPMELGMGYTAFLPNTATHIQQSTEYFGLGNQQTSEPMALTTQSYATMSPPGMDATQQQAGAPDFNRHSPSLSLTPPITYSFQESTFGRRLHRAGIEAAYYLILNRHKRPATYDRVFKLSSMARDDRKILSDFKAIMDRGPHEDLDFWEAPLIHVGGAGTHYARKDQFGNIRPKKQTFNVGIIGPQALALLDSKAQLGVDMTVEIAGFEGEWFDPYDVEGYLEEKGIHIDPLSSFAEAEVTEWPSSPSSGSGSTQSSAFSPSTPPPRFSTDKTSAPFTAEQLHAMQMLQADLTRWDDNLSNLSFSGVGYSDAQTGSFMNIVETGLTTKVMPEYDPGAWQGDARPTDMMQQPMMNALGQPMGFAAVNGMALERHSPLPRKRGVIVDVSKFIRILVASSVCLGRSAGYKRRDVDRALAVASFDV